jgi:hypothetical protein
VTAQKLTAHYVDSVRERGATPDPRDIGHLAREAKRLLDEGRSPERIEEAITQLVRAGSRPHALGSYTTQAELRHARKVDPQTELDRRFRAFLDEHGWPTGASWTRGAHGGSYVYDPLGTEKLPPGYEGWPHGRPTAAQIKEALAEADR